MSPSKNGHLINIVPRLNRSEKNKKCDISWGLSWDLKIFFNPVIKKIKNFTSFCFFFILNITIVNMKLSELNVKSTIKNHFPL